MRAVEMRQILVNLVNCRRCGLDNAAGATHCAACGLDLGGQNATWAAPVPQATAGPAPQSPVQAPPAARPLARPTAAPPPAPARPGPSYISALLRWRAIDGTVIHVGHSNLGHLSREWWEMTVKLLAVATLVIALGATALAILAVVLLLSLLGTLLKSLLTTQEKSSITVVAGSRQGFFGNLASQLASFFLIGKLFGPKRMVPVCDYRLRDGDGNEHQVRLEGHLVAGAMAVGDAVTVRGFDHGGTLIVRSGWNHRVTSRIRLRRR